MLCLALALPLPPVAAAPPARHAEAPFVAEYPHDEGDAPRGLMRAILLYPANRFLDLLDIGGFNLGFGFGLHVHTHITRLIQFGIGGGSTAKFGEAGGTREWGMYQETRGEFSLLTFSFENFSQTDLLGSVVDYTFRNEPDRLYTEKRTFWGFGVDVTAGVAAVGFEFRPLEVIDFLAGLLTFDPMGDDF